MSGFMKYQHVEHLYNGNVEGLLDGVVSVFPKMDGGNCGVFIEDNGVMRGCTRNQPTDGTHPFDKFVANHPAIERFMRDHPGIRMYGEWMVPHIVRTYTPDVWNKWLVFDVLTDGTTLKGMGRTESGWSYVPYETYSVLLDRYGIEYIPRIANINKPTVDALSKLADSENWRVSENQGVGEGIVVKRYDFVNQYGRTTWGKVIAGEYKEKKDGLHRNRWTPTCDCPEAHIVDTYIDAVLVNKEFAKIENSDAVPKSYPGRLLGAIYHCLIEENMYEIVRHLKDPKIDFKLLHKLCDLKVKEIRPDLYDGSMFKKE